MAYYAFARIGELVPSDCAQHTNFTDAQIECSCTSVVIIVTFTSFKHAHGRVASVQTDPTGHSYACPVALIIDYMRWRGSKPGPFFSQHDGGLFPRETVAKSLKQHYILLEFH